MANNEKLFNEFQLFLKNIDNEDKPPPIPKKTAPIPIPKAPIIEKTIPKIKKVSSSTDNILMKNKLEKLTEMVNQLNDGDYTISKKKPKRVATEKQRESLALAREIASNNRKTKLNNLDNDKQRIIIKDI
jgi:hypothetical protein